MGKIRDLAGERYGRATVVSNVGSDCHRKAMWRCVCDCGTEFTARGSDIVRGRIKSCGCLKKDNAIRKNTTHGASSTKLYGVWKTMISRCHNPNSTNYLRYGGRRIEVCKEWRRAFESFRAWAISNGYSIGFTIDRVDNNGKYSPQNCRWATMRQQCINRRSNHRVTIGNETKTISEWRSEYGVPRATFDQRLKKGWSGDELICGKTPPAPLRGGEHRAGQF